MSPSGLTPYAQKAVPIAQKSIAAASISTSYQVIGSVFSAPVVLLIITSTLDKDVQISWDGVTDHLPLPAGDTIELDLRSDDICLPGDFGVYVKEIGDPATGNLYVSAFSV